MPGPPSLDLARSMHLGMLSTYPPTQCGLATFNAALWKELDALGLGAAGASTIHDLTSCPGTDTCKLGISSSRGLAASPRPFKR